MNNLNNIVNPNNPNNMNQSKNNLINPNNIMINPNNKMNFNPNNNNMNFIHNNNMINPNNNINFNPNNNNMNFIHNNNMINPNNNMNFNLNHNNMNFNPNNNMINSYNNMNFNPNNNMINSNNNMNFNPNINMINSNNNMNFNPNNNNIPYLGNNNMVINYNINNMNITNANVSSNSNGLINITNFTQPSNLKLPPKLDKNNKGCLRMEFLLDDINYIFVIEKINEHDCLFFFCNRKDDDAVSLHEYSCVQTFEQLKKKNKSFQICENLDEIFNTLKNIFLSLYREAKPRIDLFNEQIVLFFINPNLAGIYDDTTIYLEKHSRTIKEQFGKLQSSYVQLYHNLKNILEICDSSDKNDIKIKKIRAICDESPNTKRSCIII